MLFQKRKGNDNTFSLEFFKPLEIVVTPIYFHDITRNFSNSHIISNDKIIRHVTYYSKKESTPVIPLLPPRNSSSIEASWATHLEAIIEGKERKRRERRERMESRRKARREEKRI